MDEIRGYEKNQLRVIFLQIFWRLMVQWKAGGMMCKVFQVVRAFGPYLSSTIIICISLDRYFAVLHPLKVINP